MKKGKKGGLEDFTTVELAAANLVSKISPNAEKVRDALVKIDPRINEALLMLGLAMMEKVQKTPEVREMGVN